MELNQFDTTEVLFSHIDLVFVKIDQIHSLSFRGSPLENAISRRGSDISDFIKEIDRSKTLPKINSNIRRFLAEQDAKIREIAELSNYIICWAQEARKVLMTLSVNSVELDIHWNHFFTIRYCSIFVALCKVVLFFYHHQIAASATQLAQFLENPVKCRDTLPKVSKICAGCKRNPFMLLETKDNVVMIQLGQLISNNGEFLIQVLGPWPLVDWQQFVILNNTDISKKNQSTLPDNEFLCLQNLSLLAETTFFFCMAYPDFINKHPQFKALMDEVLSESDNIQISKAYWIPITDLFAAYQLGERNQIKIDENIVKQHRDIKFNMAHIQRLTHLNFLLQDIANVSETEAGFLPLLTQQVLALSGYAYYEISIMLKDSGPCSQVAEVLDVLVRLAKIYIKYDQPIARFFTFNLGTIDTNFFNQLYNRFSNATFEWQASLSYYVGNLLYFLQTGIDLQEFDNGTRYDFTPFIYTMGRVIHYYNYLRLTNHIAYLNILFEHLEVIRNHMLFAQSPLNAFLTYCPIHTLWRFSSQFSNYASQTPGGMHLNASIVNLYAFFNLDSLAMCTLKNDFDQSNNSLSSIRGEIINCFNRLINNYLQPDSKLMKIVKQNRFDSLFNPNEYVLKDEFSLTDYEDGTRLTNPLWQMKECLFNLPNTINFCGNNTKICSYVSNALANNMKSILFKRMNPDSFTMDAKFNVATSILWPLYAQLNSSFSVKLYVSTFEQASGIPNTNYLDLVSRFKHDDEIASNSSSSSTKREDPKPPVVVIPTIINSFENAIRDFLNTEWFNTLYLPHSQRFSQQGTGSIISLKSFETLILNFGTYAGYYIDHILIQQAARSMDIIFKIFNSCATNTNSWLIDYRNSGNLWCKELERPEFGKAGKEMIRLGVVLMIRSLIRTAMKNALDKTVPGFSDVIVSAYKATPDHLSEKEDLLIELATDIPFFHFFESTLEKYNLQKNSDPTKFFFFLALLLGNSQWNDVNYFADHEIMTHNLHLFPVAVDAFINLFKYFSISSDSKIIQDGMQFFFNVLQQVIYRIQKFPNVDSVTINCFVILVDLFPRNIKNIEYGTTSDSFPSNIIAETYRLMEQRTKSERSPKKKR